MNWRQISELKSGVPEQTVLVECKIVTSLPAYRNVIISGLWDGHWLHIDGVLHQERVVPLKWCPITPPAEQQGDQPDIADIRRDGTKKRTPLSERWPEDAIFGEVEGLDRINDSESIRLLEWIRDPHRKSPELAFTSGPLRVIADLYLMAIRHETELIGNRRDAERLANLFSHDFPPPPIGSSDCRCTQCNVEFRSEDARSSECKKTTDAPLWSVEVESA